MGAGAATARTASAGRRPRLEAPYAERHWRPGYPLDARLTLSLLRHGGGDPCHRVGSDGAVWRTSRMPSGAVSYRIAQPAPDEIHAQAWGSGAEELLATLPALLGECDDPAGFVPRHPLLADAHRRHGGLRVPASGRVLEALIPAVLEQKVIGLDAAAAWRRLVHRFGEPPPGPAPAGMAVPPGAEGWLRVPSWEWHRAGVDNKRARTARVCASYAGRLEQLAEDNAHEPVTFYRALTSLPGVGRWTAAQVGHRALGDADALPVGDYHLASLTGWALTGATLPDDEVEQFYEPWRPHRFRVVRLLELTPGAWPPRRGPRLTRQDYRAI